MNPIMVKGAKRASPTKKHLPLVWENMLGTVYARSPETGQIAYFDYNYTEAHSFARLDQMKDLRVARSRIHYQEAEMPRWGQWVLYGKPANS